ncbi:hypothetical protein [Gilvibacter sp.]|uniref:hypothetical protein n=1 Tax=Gilvibacter sp. TaxID=2729997 RepID=UPI003F49D8FD
MVFLIGSLLMVILNKGLGYGEEFMADWFVWVILAWFCFTALSRCNGVHYQ